MQFFAQVQAVIELCDLLQVNVSSPPDRIFKRYYKVRKYIGSKDRRFIGDLFFDVIRNWDIICTSTAGDSYPKSDVESVVLLYAVNKFPDAEWPENAEFKATYAPKNIDKAKWQGVLKAAPNISLNEIPTNNFLYQKLLASFGTQAKKIWLSLQVEAKTCIRLGGHPKPHAIEGLAEQLNGTPTKFSPYGIRLNKRISQELLNKFPKITIQDEGSQILSALCPVKEGMHILDLCAGAGGKSLTLAEVHPKARITATDINPKRLTETRRRMARLNVKNLALKRFDSIHHKKYDGVVLDVPCSGSGTLRRAPDLYLKLDDGQLKEFVKTQRSILKRATKLVKKGGFLAYMTCSLLNEEDNENKQWFFNTFKNFKPLNLSDMWQLRLNEDYPSKNSEELQLLPHIHETDGFYCFIAKKDES